MKILIGYDGSADARAGLTLAGHVFDGHTAVGLTVWDGFSEALARSGGSLTLTALDFEEIERTARRAAWECASDGTGHARVAGLRAEARTARCGMTVGEAILDEAAAVAADVIVLGSRGLTGIKSLLPGSVSQGVLSHADRPVLVAPSSEVARKREQRRRSRQLPVGADAPAGG